MLAALATGTFGTVALGGAWAGAGWILDGANGAGFTAVAMLTFLHVDTGAARHRPPAQAAFHARLHANVAALALAIAALHVVVLLVDDPVTLEYWKLSAPPYVLAGIAGLLLMATIVATSYPTPRRALFVRAAQFRHTHAATSLALAALVTLHVAGSGLYLDTRPKQVVFAAMCIGLPLVLLWRRARPASRPASDTPRRAPIEARAEIARIGAVTFVLAAAFAALRNLT